MSVQPSFSRSAKDAIHATEGLPAADDSVPTTRGDPGPTAPHRHTAWATHRARIGKFVLSGGLAAVINTSLTYLLSRAGTDPHIAFSVGFVSALAVRFFVDRHLVFAASDQRIAGQIPRYAAACLASYLVSAGLFSLFLDVAGLSEAASFVLAVVLSTAVGYLSIKLALTGRRSVRA